MGIPQQQTGDQVNHCQVRRHQAGHCWDRCCPTVYNQIKPSQITRHQMRHHNRHQQIGQTAGSHRRVIHHPIKCLQVTQYQRGHCQVRHARSDATGSDTARSYTARSCVQAGGSHMINQDTATSDAARSDADRSPISRSDSGRRHITSKDTAIGSSHTLIRTLPAPMSPPSERCQRLTHHQDQSTDRSHTPGQT